MKIDTKELLKVLPHFEKHPYLFTVIMALAVPMVLIYSATKFVSAPLEALVFFGFLGTSVLVYSVWVVSSLKRSSNDSFKEKN